MYTWKPIHHRVGRREGTEVKDTKQKITPWILVVFLAVWPAMVSSQSTTPVAEAEVEFLVGVNHAVVTGDKEELAAARAMLQERIESDGDNVKIQIAICSPMSTGAWPNLLVKAVRKKRNAC